MDFDWIRCWRQLVEERASRKLHNQSEPGVDPWQQRAAQFHNTVHERWNQPDSSRSFILEQLNSQATLLDVGAGSGAWAALLAHYVRQVTALETSPAMLVALRKTLQQKRLTNVIVVQGGWPETDLPVHDFSLCAHAMYGAADLPAFIHKLNNVTRCTCFLIIRVIQPGSPLAEASQRVLGTIHYRPHFDILNNALAQMGIFAQVIMEDTGIHSPWLSPSHEEAVSKIKEQLHIERETYHDEFLMDLMRRRLEPCAGQFRWPASIRSALLYWSPAKTTSAPQKHL